MDIKIGCTGWSYEGWHGSFYPKSLESTRFLRYYSEIFDFTEINSTYYRIPNQFMVSKWNTETPKNFRFTAKFPKIITHEKRLKQVQSDVIEFLHSLSPIKQKLIALLLQLPPSLSFQEAKPRLQELFQYLPDNYLYPIEGRHSSWFSAEAIQFLKQNNLCLVWNEIEGVKNPAHITSNYIYLRLIGDRSIPEEQFGRVIKDRTYDIERWTSKIKQQQGSVDSVYVLANNHFEGFAPATANSIRERFGMSELFWEEKRQKKLGDF